MPEERLVSITSSLHLTPDDIARHTFGTARRGFDPDEVRAYLESVAAGLRTVVEREHELLKVLSDAEHRAANPILDEPTLTAALGTETARVLHSAHEVAAEMVAKAEAEATRLLTDAREEIEQTRTTTEAALEQRTSAVEAAAADLRERTEQQATAGMEKARLEAEVLLSQARDQCRAMVDEAQGLRARVLSDLAKRRKVLHAQIEQLRAGRERLAETIHDVRRSIDVIADDLFAAEDNARLAAEAAGREAAARTDESSPEELASELLAGEAVVAEAGLETGEPAAPKGDDGPSGGDLDVVEIDIDVVGSGIVELDAEGADAEGADGGPAEVAGESVDELFAKLRAASVTSVEPEGRVPGAPDPVEESGPTAEPEGGGTAGAGEADRPDGKDVGESAPGRRGR